MAKGVPAEELERAKLAAISSVYMNLESRAVVAEDIGRQILTYGHRCRPTHALSAQKVCLHQPVFALWLRPYALFSDSLD